MSAWRLVLRVPAHLQLTRSYRTDRNGGENILLRLRPHHDDSAFLPEEDVVGTMLHEVCPMSYATLMVDTR